MSTMAYRSKEEIEEEEVSRFHGLPPLKRFKLLQRESRMHERNDTSLCLPAKKRIWAVRDFMFEQERALEGGALFKVPKCEEMGTIAYKWCKSTRKRSQKAPCKSFESVQEKKTIEKLEDVPHNVGKVHKPERREEQQTQQEEEEDDGIICNVCR